MKSVKTSFGVATVCICFFILLVYHFYHFSFVQNYSNTDFIVEQLSLNKKRSYNAPMKHVPLNEIYNDMSDRDQDFSIEFEESKQGNIMYTIKYISLTKEHF